MNKWGMTLEERDELFAKGCQICGVYKRGKMVIDHNHKTGEFRGCLCSVCNLEIGRLGDGQTLDRLVQIGSYLGFEIKRK